MMAGWVELWLIFIGVMALGQFSPGPDMLLLTRVALASGRAAGCATAVGIACGLGVHAAIAVTGVAVVLGHGGVLGTVLLWLAAAYLVWLAVPLIRHGLQRNTLAISEADPAGSVWSCWKKGLFCNLLNPKVAIFLAGVTTPFLSIPEPPTAWPVILWLTIIFEGLFLWCGWVFVLQSPSIKKRYLRAAHWFDLFFGIALLVAAAVLVV